jgi:diguanylate cyclase (GGDEF)-like protein
VQDYKRIFLLALILLAVTATVGTTAISILYQTAMEGVRSRLVETAQSQARLIESVSRFDQAYSHDYPAGATTATLSQLRDALQHYQGPGETGELIVFQQDGSTIKYLWPSRHSGTASPSFELNASHSEPARRALAGQSGTWLGLDYRNEWVLAAYEPIAALNLALINKLDLSEIRAPFVKAGTLIGITAFCLVIGGTILLFWVTNPMVQRVRDSVFRFRELFENMSNGVAVFEAIDSGSDFIFKDFNRSGERIERISRTELRGRVLSDVFPPVRESGLLDALSRVWRTGQPEHLGPLFYQDDQRSGWREYSLYKLPNDEVVAVYEDVTRRRQAEEALQQAYDNMEALVTERTQELLTEINERRQVETVLREREISLANAQQIAKLGNWEFDLRTQETICSQEVYRLLECDPAQGPLHLEDVFQYYPEDGDRLRQSLRCAIKEGKRTEEELHLQLPSGTSVYHATVITPVKDEHGEVIKLIGTVQDVTERKQTEQRILHLASHDVLTGLPNRSLLMDRLVVALAGARRSHAMTGLLFVDLDHFKPVNDKLGHEAGDILLKQVADRLSACVREADTVARLGGDEFVIVLVNIRTSNDAQRVAEKLVESLRRPFQLHDSEVTISASIGIALYPQHGLSTDQLLQQADDAMYVAKKKGKDRYQFAQPDLPSAE